MKIYRIYPNGEYTDETHVLKPHTSYEGLTIGTIQCLGYNGNVSTWSEHNKRVRGGCAQVQVIDNVAKVLYKGCCSEETIKEFFLKIL